jgi:hypothetical protein
MWVNPGTQIKHLDPTCPLDNVLLDFLRERRQRALEGVLTQDLVGPRYPSVSSLLNHANSAYSHPLSKVFTDILVAFPAIYRLPEKVAVLYVMFMVMRWQIDPSEENYELTPELARPLPVQSEIPHPAWVDHVPFPAMREKLVREWSPTKYPLEEYFVPYSMTLSINWPYEESDALLKTESGEVVINPVFIRHLCMAENWTLGDAFDKTFPSLRDTYNLKSESSSSTRNEAQVNE